MSVFVLPDSITVATAEALADNFRQLDMAQPVITLDASATEIITTPGVQLIKVLEKTLAAIGASLAIIGQKPGFTEAFSHLGINPCEESKAHE